MRLHFFSVSAQFPEQSQQLLNTFCAQHRVLTVDKQFVEVGAESYWAICVSIIEGSELQSFYDAVFAATLPAQSIAWRQKENALRRVSRAELESPSKWRLFQFFH